MRYILPVFICLLFVSCFNEGDCLVTATNLVRIQLKKKANPTEDATTVYNLIVIKDLGAIYTNYTTKEFLLPLNIKSDSTLFIFYRADSSLPDSIQFNYVRQSKVITKDCGVYTFYQNLKVTKHTNLDSTQIKAFNKNLLKDPTSAAITAYALNYQILY